MMMMLRSGVSSVVAVVVCLLVWTQTVSVAQAQSVKVSKSCFTPDEDITITFVNRRFPASDDWIGVFAASQKNGGFASEAAWLWTCGTQSCGSSRRRGSVIVRDNIPIGEYKAVMSKDDEEPYIGYALSSVFSVRASCTDGGGGSIPVNPATENANQVAARHLKSARDEIEGLVRGDPALAGTFLRLLFHDCIGGCDGCIDTDNAENAGLTNVINILSGVVSRHAPAASGVTRADIWMMAGFAGPAALQPPNSRVDYPFLSYGRVDCENSGAACTGKNGQAVTCSATKGPHREIPGTNLNTADIYHFFSNEFGFNQRETVVIMGGHTIGRLHAEVSGIDGPNGWALSNTVLDNQFYEELVGGGPGDPVEVLVNDAPEWQRIRRNDKRFWLGRPNGVEVVMLNADISLVRNLDDSNFDKSIGRVTCTFEDSTSTESLPVCPHVSGALEIAAEFKADNKKWLQEFRDVMNRMMNKGYSRESCSDSVCKLRR